MNKQRQQMSGEPTVDHRSDIASELRIDNLTDADQGISGRGWHGNPQGHAAAGSKGGRKVSQDREHMASIGRKGGQTVSRDRSHMAAIGRKGGQARTESESANGDDNWEHQNKS